MRFETMRAAIGRMPFESFSIRTGSGEEYPVGHPENIPASPRFEAVFVKIGADRTAIIDLDSITELTYAEARPERAPN